MLEANFATGRQHMRNAAITVAYFFWASSHMFLRSSVPYFAQRDLYGWNSRCEAQCLAVP